MLVILDRRAIRKIPFIILFFNQYVIREREIGRSWSLKPGSMDNLLPFQIQAAGIQILETSYIIANSMNIDTMISRQNFMQERLSDLRLQQTNPQYAASIKLAIESYKTSYFDRPLQDYQLNILQNPNGFDTVSFYRTSLINAVKRFCSKQTEEINVMKKEGPKAKRATKTIDTIGKFRNELQDKCSAAAHYAEALVELKELEDNFNLIK